MKVMVRKSDGKVRSFGYCDFGDDLGTLYEQFYVVDKEVDENKLRMLDIYDIVRDKDGIYTVNLKT